MLNPKNFALSPAASDLGLGDQLQTQLDDALEERKKKALMAAKTAGIQGALSPATLSLFGASGSLGQVTGG